MAHSKSDALLRAAGSGAVAKIRELLADGAPLEATEVNRMTPVMLAAQGGHLEAFQMLVKAGANLHALAFRQVDLLEMAARGGNVEILRFLLDQGLPVNGHWQPTVPALRKFGHETPLIQAALHGEVAAVRLLLDAGADREAKYDGATALERIQERLLDPVYEDLKPSYREIATLLGGTAANRPNSADSASSEVAKFADNAGRPEYKRLLQTLVERCGPARPWKPLADHGLDAAAVVAFSLPHCKRQKTLEELQADARKAGCQLILEELWAPGDDAALVLFPTDNPLAVVAAVGTEGANYGVRTANVIDWLGSLESDNPFDLVFCNHELVGGTFRGPVKGVKKLAKRLVEFCPSCLDEGHDGPDELALVLKKRRSFLVRWD